MISPGVGCRECLFKVTTALDYDTDVAICPKCEARYAVLRLTHHNAETGESWEDICLGDRLYDWPIPSNFINPIPPL